MATPLRGSVPNTRWPGATLTWDELRSSSSSNPSSSAFSTPNFVPLPPLARPLQQQATSQASPPPTQHIDPARVRQDDSALTRLLHRGVLTGGYINALLGLADGGAGAARVGAPRGGGGRGGSNSHHRRNRRAAAPARLDPHAAAIEHLRQPRWDFAGEGALSSATLAEEDEAARERQRTKKKRTPEEVARGGIVSVRMAWGNAAEAAALRSLASALSSALQEAEGKGGRRQHEELFRCERWGRGAEAGAKKKEEAEKPSSPAPSPSLSSSVTLEEVGMLLVSDEALRDLLAGEGGEGEGGDGLSSLPLPPLAASPDALARHRMSSSGEKEEKEEASWLEPVEVKCVCPFRLVGRNSARRSGGRAFDDKNGGGEANSGVGNSGVNSSSPFARFELSDPGPRALPPASAVPQLQLQMLACGSRSALLVSHSATRGSRVWRVARDDAFLRRMLAVASRAFERHVVVGGGEPAPNGAAVSPPPQQQQLQEHAAGVEAVLRLADAAVAIAASAREVALLPPLEGVDPSRAFLQ